MFFWDMLVNNVIVYFVKGIDILLRVNDSCCIFYGFWILCGLF